MLKSKAVANTDEHGVMRCHCGGSFARSARMGRWDFLFWQAGLFPWKCSRCDVTFYSRQRNVPDELRKA